MFNSPQRSLGTRGSPQRGFTLIELMVVVAIVAILVAIALPSYQDSVRKGRRGQAKADLIELAQRAERFRTVNNTYTGFALAGNDQQSPRVGGKFYDIALSNLADGTFTLTATPTAGTGQEGDTLCGALSVNQAGAKTASGDASTTNENRCW